MSSSPYQYHRHALFLLFQLATIRSFTFAFLPIRSQHHHLHRHFTTATTMAAINGDDDNNNNNKHNNQTNKRITKLFPKLIVLDLDNTVWTPELYQLRTLQRANQVPVAGKDVTLFPGAQDLFDKIRAGDYFPPSTQFAVASRTKSVEWAQDLLDQFQLRELLHYVEIFPGHKKTHFENMKRDSGIPYEEMLFFDDARDGKYGNCEPVSAMNVLSVHCPNGLYENSIWETAIQRYTEWDKTSNTIVEWDGTVTNLKKTATQQLQGTIKTVNYEKRFGFIAVQDNSRKDDVFFHFSALPQDVTVEKGDSLKFTITKDIRNGKFRAANIEIVDTSAAESGSSNTISMHAFSMNMPFAALLANGYKTLESRNGTMFSPYKEGTQMLLHIGRRTYPDGNRHMEILRQAGLSDDEILKLKSLPSPAFGKGMLVAIMEIGKTYDATVQERSTDEMQRNICAYGQDSGRRLTEIKKVSYLKRPVPMAAQGGVFKVNIDSGVIPDEWELSPGLLPTSAFQAESLSNKSKKDGVDASHTNKQAPIYSISG